MSRDRRSRLRILWLCPWSTLLVSLGLLGYLLVPAIERQTRTGDWNPLDIDLFFMKVSLPFPEMPWFVYVAAAALLLALLNLGIYAAAHGFSPSRRHRIDARSLWRSKEAGISPFWANALVGGAVLAATFLTAGKWPGATSWIFGVETSLLLIWQIGFAYALHAEGETFAKAEEQRSGELQESDRRLALAQQQREEVEARQLARRNYEQRTLEFEEMRRDLMQIYLANINYLERTYWTADYIRDFFAQAETCYHERWQEVQAAYECHSYDLRLHAEVWKVAHLYEKCSHIIGDRLSKADLWVMLDSIQQTSGRKQPMQTIVQECDELSESLRLLCEQSQDSWLHQHDDDTARRYEELLEMPMAQPRASADDVETRAPVPRFAGLTPNSRNSLIPPVRITSDA